MWDEADTRIETVLQELFVKVRGILTKPGEVGSFFFSFCLHFQWLGSQPADSLEYQQLAV